MYKLDSDVKNMFLPLSIVPQFIVFLNVRLLVSAENPKRRCAKVEYIRSVKLKSSNDNIPNCTNDDICQERFKVSYINFPPYYYDGMGKYEDPPMTRILRRCCGRCVSFEEKQIFKNLSEVTGENLQNSDFIYPFFADSATRFLHGHYYLPYMDVPPIMLVTKKKEIKIGEFIENVFPITLICIFSSIISGFVCWMLETRGNQAEFPRPFLSGWFEGFWWSFISMTTVGYGDKSPKTFWGRIFSVVWISLGIISYGLLTGIVYSEVMKIKSPPPPNMEGKLIGSLLYRDYDAIIIAENGGKLYPEQHPKPEPADFIEDVLLLINKLREGEINGFVLDQYTYWKCHFMASNLTVTDLQRNLITNEDARKSIEFFMKNTVTTSFSYKGAERLSYGILVGNQRHYDYFVDMVKELRMRDRAKALDMWNSYIYDSKIYMHNDSVAEKVGLYKEDANTLFSYKELPFMISIASIAGLILVILVFGFAFEMRRTRGNLSCTRATTESVEVEEANSLKLG